MAGEAEGAACIVYYEEIRVVRVYVLHVRIVATGALDVIVDESNRASLIGRGGRVRGQ